MGVPLNEVFMTLVRPEKLFVRATVEEANLQHFRQGLAGKVQVTARPDLKLPAKVVNVSSVPIEPGSFEARIALEPAHPVYERQPAHRSQNEGDGHKPETAEKRRLFHSWTR